MAFKLRPISKKCQQKILPINELLLALLINTKQVLNNFEIKNIKFESRLQKSVRNVFYLVDPLCSCDS